MIFALSTLLTTTTTSTQVGDGDYKICPKLKTHRIIDAIMLIDSDLVKLIGSKEEAISEVKERVIETENQIIRENLNLEIKIVKWFVTEDNKGRVEMCDPKKDAITLENNRKVFLKKARDLGGERQYPFVGFVHKCDFERFGKNVVVTVVNWVMHIGGRNPEEYRNDRFVFPKEAFGYRYLAREGSAVLGAWHSERGNDLLAQNKPVASSVFHKDEIKWICEYGFSKDEEIACTEGDDNCNCTFNGATNYCPPGHSCSLTDGQCATPDRSSPNVKMAIEEGTIKEATIEKPDTTTGAPVITEDNEPCVFPFTYEDQTYEACTEVESNEGPWCATKVDGNGNLVENKWSYCKNKCSPNPCKRGGRCVPSSNDPKGYECKCRMSNILTHGYGGEHCDQKFENCPSDGLFELKLNEICLCKNKGGVYWKFDEICKGDGTSKFQCNFSSRICTKE